jgi:hypothetical protein
LALFIAEYYFFDILCFSVIKNLLEGMSKLNVKFKTKKKPWLFLLMNNVNENGTFPFMAL